MKRSQGIRDARQRKLFQGFGPGKMEKRQEGEAGIRQV